MYSSLISCNCNMWQIHSTASRRSRKPGAVTAAEEEKALRPDMPPRRNKRSAGTTHGASGYAAQLAVTGRKRVRGKMGALASLPQMQLDPIVVVDDVYASRVEALWQRLELVCFGGFLSTASTPSHEAAVSASADKSGQPAELATEEVVQSEAIAPATAQEPSPAAAAMVVDAVALPAEVKDGDSVEPRSPSFSLTLTRLNGAASRFGFVDFEVHCPFLVDFSIDTFVVRACKQLFGHTSHRYSQANTF